MRAARLHRFDTHLTGPDFLSVDEVPEPEITHPDDVIVQVGAAGLCQTDLHTIQGMWAEMNPVPLPFILGHENAGWVAAVGSAVTDLRPGDPVAVHPQMTDGTCPACLAGNDMYCTSGSFTGSNRNGGFAELVLTKQRSLVRLPPSLPLEQAAALADAGVTAYHSVKKVLTRLVPGSTTVVIGIGGLGHLAVQILRAVSSSRVIAIDRTAGPLELAERLGAQQTMLSSGDVTADLETVQGLTGGGADVVLDFVGLDDTATLGLAATRLGGAYVVAGYGGHINASIQGLILGEKTIYASQVGTYQDLHELVQLAADGRVIAETTTAAFDQINGALADLRDGNVTGRLVITPRISTPDNTNTPDTSSFDNAHPDKETTR